MILRRNRRKIQACQSSITVHRSSPRSLEGSSWSTRTLDTSSSPCPTKERCYLKEATEEDTEGKQFRGAFESVFKKASMRDLQQD